MTSFVVCLTTVGSRSAAEKIGRRLVGEKVVACVNVVPDIVSFYHWKGKLCRDRELLLIIKTTSAKVKKLESLLHQIHPYDLPEFVVLPVVGGSRRYRDWIREGVKNA